MGWPVLQRVGSSEVGTCVRDVLQWSAVAVSMLTAGELGQGDLLKLSQEPLVLAARVHRDELQWLAVVGERVNFDSEPHDSVGPAQKFDRESQASAPPVVPPFSVAAIEPGTPAS